MLPSYALVATVACGGATTETPQSNFDCTAGSVLASVEGHSVTALTATNDFVFHPTEREADGVPALWRVSTHGGAAARIATLGGPTWHLFADASHVYFAHYVERLSASYDTYRVSVAGGSPERILPGFRFSRDGTHEKTSQRPVTDATVEKA